ncbi:MAG TPA: hypothetical protein PLZ12_01785 [Saprospiraceae bacterium]|nr:hypothetical protein [Candidatus Kapabacteria bacterium]HRK80144.1 hypothetical protein [Saprospiraceae bacterium]
MKELISYALLFAMLYAVPVNAQTVINEISATPLRGDTIPTESEKELFHVTFHYKPKHRNENIIALNLLDANKKNLAVLEWHRNEFEYSIDSEVMTVRFKIDKELASKVAMVEPHFWIKKGGSSQSLGNEYLLEPVFLHTLEIKADAEQCYYIMVPIRDYEQGAEEFKKLLKDYAASGKKPSKIPKYCDMNPVPYKITISKVIRYKFLCVRRAENEIREDVFTFGEPLRDTIIFKFK